MLTEEQREMRRRLHECDTGWGDHKLADSKYPEYLHFLTALYFASQGDKVVETFIAKTSAADDAHSGDFRITLLTENTWILAKFSSDPLTRGIQVVPRSSIQSVSLDTEVPEDVYRFDQVYGFSVVIDGERLHFDSNAATTRGGSVPNLLAAALSDLAKR